MIQVLNFHDGQTDIKDNANSYEAWLNPKLHVKTDLTGSYRVKHYLI